MLVTSAAGCGLLFWLCLQGSPGDGSLGLASIEKSDIAERLEIIASPNMEGRDSPSEGQARAASYITGLFAEFGLKPAADARAVLAARGGERASKADENLFLRPFSRELSAPDPAGCHLALLEKDEITAEFELGRDFQPIHRAGGSVRGELLFGGFGIQSKRAKYDDFKGQRPAGRVVLIFEGEPRHKRKFDGTEVTRAASIWTQLETLKAAGAVGALVVQRSPFGVEVDPQNALDFRYTWAAWQGEQLRRQPARSLPALHISMDCASELLGTDARKLALKLDKRAKPQKLKTRDRSVSFDSATRRMPVRHDNLVAILPGTDEALARQFVVLGAHYDHVGVGPRGRVACGADDNGSGVSALLEIAEALALNPPRRSVIFASFCAEEDGLIGSREFCANLPVDAKNIVCMVNLDQIGVGPTKQTSVLGTAHNPQLSAVLARAKQLGKTGITKIHHGRRKELGQSIKLFERSDHFEFHRIGIPAIFFFEGLPLSNNKDYHTWRDTVEGVDLAKTTSTAKLVYNTIWILANDDARPPKPRD